MITASLPVYVRGDLIGVAAVDVTIEELFAETTYIVPGELSYSFVINGAGELLGIVLDMISLEVSALNILLFTVIILPMFL